MVFCGLRHALEAEVFQLVYEMCGLHRSNSAEIAGAADILVGRRWDVGGDEVGGVRKLQGATEDVAEGREPGWANAKRTTAGGFGPLRSDPRMEITKGPIELGPGGAAKALPFGLSNGLDGWTMQPGPERQIFLHRRPARQVIWRYVCGIRRHAALLFETRVKGHHPGVLPALDDPVFHIGCGGFRLRRVASVWR